MNIIDFHAHIYPEKIAKKAVESVGEFYNIPMDRNGTVEALLQEGEKSGIDKFLVHSVAVIPDYVKTINNFIAAQCEEHDNFYGFGTIHADLENPLAEIERMESLGLRGIKIHPDTQHFNIDDPKMMKIYEIIEGRLPILIHCGDYRYDYSHPRRLAKVLAAFPNLVAIGAHFGAWSMPDLAVEYLENTNCYVDVSSSMMYTGKRRAKELIRLYGADRVLFGSDFPMWNPSEELDFFLSLGLSDDENKAILWNNAMKILKEK